MGKSPYDKREEMDEPVSVVIPYSPAHTPESLLEQATETATSQSVPVEMIIIEDTEQRGPAWARNRGLERADTRYVAFLDADDFWHDDKLERQLAEMDRTGAGVCVESDGLTEPQFMCELFLGNVSSVMSSVVIDTNKVDARFEENLERREDHLFILEAASQAELCLLPDLFNVGGHDSSLSTNTPVGFRLKQDYYFARHVIERAPDVARYLDKFYGESQCNPDTSNTPGDVFRAAVLWPSFRAVFGVAFTIISQRVYIQ